ncbi:polysaccharide deacetylase family protein [Streptomyces sp. SID3343]|uniref:polysaccharide deacetylase family protein n=1 Tax=Streptomyces sp. SID3343 TaxID=2690260 RepID=UPI001369D972|nr:polysaccharide deacetylase family protein [Streptomyces sp. SID3343]MYV99887.1 polysaccharide deacetylase family protein [Streptomyces sp. SID3343]
MDTTSASSRRTFLLGAAASLGLLGAAAPTAFAGSDRPTPRPAFVPEPVRTVEAGPLGIAVTFDDGPHPEFTPQVLRVLRRNRVRATFCVVGTEVEKYPDLVRAIHRHGHTIACHSWSHANLQELTPAGVGEEVERGLAAIGRVLPGYRVGWFRAPYGRWSSEVMGAIRAAGLRPLGWSVDPRDWERPGTDEIVRRVLADVETGSIILNHDGGGNRDQTVAALRQWLPELSSFGYRFVQPA